MRFQIPYNDWLYFSALSAFSSPGTQGRAVRIPFCAATTGKLWYDDDAMIKSVTVYCASSSRLALSYRNAAAELGRAIGANGWELVFGGVAAGLMEILGQAAKKAGARVVGVVPKDSGEIEMVAGNCDEVIVTDDMAQRKITMLRRGDAIIALPGGVGTYDEIFDALVGKHLGLHKKPFILLNIDGYFQPLVNMIDHGITHEFIKPRVRQLIHLADSVNEAVEVLRASKRISAEIG